MKKTSPFAIVFLIKEFNQEIVLEDAGSVLTLQLHK